VVISARPFDEKKETLAKEMGATHTVSLLGDGEEKIAELIREISGGLGADVVFEGSGSPKAIPLAMEILRNRGVYIVPGQYSASGGIEIQPQVITFKALQILGSSQYTFCDVEAYVEFLRKNPDVQKMLVAMATGYKVEEADKAFADAKARKNIKTVLTDCDPTIVETVKDYLPKATHIIPVYYWFKLVADDYAAFTHDRIKWCTVRDKDSLILQPQAEQPVRHRRSVRCWHPGNQKHNQYRNVHHR